MRLKTYKALGLTTLLILTLTPSGSIPAHGQGHSEGSVDVMKPTNCETDEASFNVVRLAAEEGLGAGELLIVVARLGEGEKLRGLNRKRLGSVREWMTINNFLRGRMLFTEGERVRGSGRVEFYIGGKLTQVILTRKNAWLCTRCCDPKPEDFTSYRKKRKKR